MGDTPRQVYCVPVVSHWTVAFMSGPRRSIWDWLTREPYRHCACYGWANDHWVLIDPADGRLFASALDQKGLEDWLTANAHRITSLVRIEAGNHTPLVNRAGIWCSNVVAYAVARGVGAFTPEGLKRVLLRHGAKEI